jgi:hypothetical protein
MACTETRRTAIVGSRYQRRPTPLLDEHAHQDDVGVSPALRRLLLAFLLACVLCSQARAEGAIAHGFNISTNQHWWAHTYDRHTLNDALLTAYRSCITNGWCAIITWYRNTCFALAVSYNSTRYATDLKETVELASSWALHHCGSSCRVVVSGCDTVSETDNLQWYKDKLGTTTDEWREAYNRAERAEKELAELRSSATSTHYQTERAERAERERQEAQRLLRSTSADLEQANRTLSSIRSQHEGEQRVNRTLRDEIHALKNPPSFFEMTIAQFNALLAMLATYSSDLWMSARNAPTSTHVAAAIASFLAFLLAIVGFHKNRQSRAAGEEAITPSVGGTVLGDAARANGSAPPPSPTLTESLSTIPLSKAPEQQSPPARESDPPSQGIPLRYAERDTSASTAQSPSPVHLASSTKTSTPPGDQLGLQGSSNSSDRDVQPQLSTPRDQLNSQSTTSSDPPLPTPAVRQSSPSAQTAYILNLLLPGAGNIYFGQPVIGTIFILGILLGLFLLFFGAAAAMIGIMIILISMVAAIFTFGLSLLIGLPIGLVFLLMGAGPIVAFVIWLFSLIVSELLVHMKATRSPAVAPR